MKILSFKLSHDGTLALVEGNKLIFSYEMEKLNNRDRIIDFDLDFNEVQGILTEYGYTFDAIDEIVMDGWTSDDSVNKGVFKNAEILPNTFVDIELEKYGHFLSKNENMLSSKQFKLDILDIPYSSYMHTSGHLYSAYCTSPFAKRKEDTFVLIWDGGMFPHLFYYKYKENTSEYLGFLFPIGSSVYTGIAHLYSPFNQGIRHHYSVPGKYMAYTAVGNCDDKIMEELEAVFNKFRAGINEELLNTHKELSDTGEDFIEMVRVHFEALDFPEKDILTTFHHFIEKILISSLTEKVETYSSYTKNLCYTGGSALSIKWNSAIRETELFDEMWVPPFPNDAGSAIGAACCMIMDKSDKRFLEWDVYSGPKITTDPDKIELKEFETKSCLISELAKLMYETDQPVVFLNDRAAMGPRALGNRSILASPTSPSMKEILNRVKNRESYRPVAPICLEEDAQVIFSPGTPDPYMLFEHQVKEEWKEKVPAIIHIDGSARLQTINEEQNKTVYNLIKEFRALSGIPVLCNTSANFNGKGFFPDVQSAIDWDRLNYIWSNNTLYIRKQPLDLLQNLN